jgi:hypothetical protein
MRCLYCAGQAGAERRVLGVGQQPARRRARITLDKPVGFGVQVYLDNKKWSHTAQGWQNEWEPQQPGLLTCGQVIYFYLAATDTLLPVPTVT